MVAVLIDGWMDGFIFFSSKFNDTLTPVKEKQFSLLVDKRFMFSGTGDNLDSLSDSTCVS